MVDGEVLPFGASGLLHTLIHRNDFWLAGLASTGRPPVYAGTPQ